MYRSKFEKQIADWLRQNNIKFTYEPCVLNYIVPESKHKYTPDWVFGNKEKKKQQIYYESKGRFTAQDRKKMLLVRESNPDVVIRIIFQNSTVKITKTSKTSYADWCIKNEFDFFCWKLQTKDEFKKWINYNV